MALRHKINSNTHYIFLLEKEYEKADFVMPAENNSQPMNSLDIAESTKEGNNWT